MKHDHLEGFLRSQPDFRAAKIIVEEELTNIGADVLFGMKFHPGKYFENCQILKF